MNGSTTLKHHFHIGNINDPPIMHVSANLLSTTESKLAEEKIEVNVTDPDFRLDKFVWGAAELISTGSK